jgi:hypothetical protein
LHRIAPTRELAHAGTAKSVEPDVDVPFVQRGQRQSTRDRDCDTRNNALELIGDGPTTLPDGRMNDSSIAHRPVDLGSSVLALFRVHAVSGAL